VREETGLRCRAGPELAPSRYTDNRGRAKLVRYWLMAPVDGEFAPSAEVDELRWCEAEEAVALLTYERDRALALEGLRRAAELSDEARS
jgi:8-oxo-dGTP diphosphatase